MKRIGKWLVAVTVFVLVSRVLPVQAWTETYCWASCPAGSVGLVFVGSAMTLVLTRLEACNLAGCAIRLTDGFWHNEAFVAAQPPPVPSNIAIAP